MANRYAEEIRRIVGVDNLAGGIGAQTPKQPIVGGRGIAYFNADGSIGSDSGTKGETTQPEDAADGNAVTDGDGNTGDDITHEPVGDEGIVPVTDLFDGTLGIGDSFTGVNGLEDCATGQEYEVRGDGQFNAPEGWEDANTPPINNSYDAGYYWNGGVASSTSKPTAEEIFYIYQASAQSIGRDLEIVGQDPDSLDPSLDQFILRQFNPATNGTTGWGSITQYECNAGHAGQAYCNPVAGDLGPTEWPASTPAQIAWDSESSSFITSQYDGNVASQYKSNNAGQVSLCDSSGNQFTVVPSKDGGLVFTDVTKNIFIVRNSHGKITAAGSGSNRDQYVAK
jgi:hypothetical protein